MVLKTYCGFIDDNKKLIQSASGGLATAMAESMINQGNVVYGAAYSDGFKSVEYIRVTDYAGIELLKGSKYIKATIKRPILESIICDLHNFSFVLFIGLPCDVNIIKSYIKKSGIDDSNLLCIDLICHGPTYPKVAAEYIERLNKKNKSEIVNFNVRYKSPYWTPPYLYAEFKNGKKIIEPFYESDYGIAFMMMSKPMCYKCNNKGDNYKSDITIGDYWGCREGDIGYNKYGTSVAFVHSCKGDKFINSLSGFKLYTTDFQKAVAENRRYLYPTEKTVKSENFKKNFDQKGLKYAVKKHLKFKGIIKRKLKKHLKAHNI